MKLNTMFSIYGVAAVISCILYLLLPAFSICLYGATVNGQGILLFRVIGSLFGGLAIMTWLGRNAAPSKSRDAMVLGLARSNALAAFLAALGEVCGVFNRFAWDQPLAVLCFPLDSSFSGQTGSSRDNA